MSQVSRINDPVAQQFLDDKLEDIRRLYAPVHIIIFGSRATGKAREDSDLDLIVVSDRFKDKRLPDRMAEFQLAINPEPDVEAFCYTPEEFEKLRGQVSIVAEAAREGIWIQ